MMDSYYRQLGNVQEEAAARALGAHLKVDGFTAVRRLLDDLRDDLRNFAEQEWPELSKKLHFAKVMLPDPGKHSPAFAHIWAEFDVIIDAKREVLETIATDERDGEWQVLIDNPHSSEHIAVYPDLHFVEAAYLYAYFRAQMMRNEYIRLQRVTNVMTFRGQDVIAKRA
jgi:hypothetical protein